MITLDINFNGYWLESNKLKLPKAAGIYNVYACRYSEHNNAVSITRHLYTGESHNIRNRILGHERFADWTKSLKKDEVLCYSCAKIDGVQRLIGEAAIINIHKPLLNNEYRDEYPFRKPP